MQADSNSQIQQQGIIRETAPSVCEDAGLQVQICEIQLLATNAVDQESIQNIHEQSYHHLYSEPLNPDDDPELSSFDVVSLDLMPGFTEQFQRLEHVMQEFWEQNNQSMSLIRVYLNNLTHRANPISKKKKFDKLSKIRASGHECSICYEKIKKNSNVPKIDCRHKFHQKCLLKWVEHKDNCPLCRDRIE